MGKRIIIKGANFSSVAVSKETISGTITFGTSVDLWNLATTVLAKGNLARGVGFAAPQDGKLLTLLMNAPSAGDVTLNICNQSTVVSSQQITLQQGYNEIPLNINVSQGQLLLLNAITRGPLAYGNGAGDYQTYTDSTFDNKPHALSFNFVLGV